MSRVPLRVENKKTVLKQVEQPRMGRPPNREVYATWLNATLELAAAIKLGSGGKSNKAIEEGLCIGTKDKVTGEYTGRYFARYLNKSGKGKPVAMPPHLMNQAIERAQELGWLEQPPMSGLIKKPDPFVHQGIPEAEVLSERLSQIQQERLELLQARQEALAALEHLSSVMASCRLAGFMHAREDIHEGRKVNVWFDGLDIDLASIAATIAAASVIVD